MTGRRALGGLSLVCALALCALAAPNAMALKGTTAYTCVHVTEAAAFEDEHCTKDAEGGEGWIHAEIEPGAAETKLAVSNNETGSKNVTAKLSTEVKGEKVAIDSGAAKSCAEKTMVMNRETAFKKMYVEGFYCVEFFNNVVKEPANCVVDKVITVQGPYETRVELNGKKEEEMWVLFKPFILSPFTQFTLADKEGKKCSLNGQKVTIEGTARSNVSTSELIEGSTVKFTAAETEKTLTTSEGKVVKFEATLTPRMTAVGGQDANPVSLTTTEI
jgi:hypothetical protein